MNGRLPAALDAYDRQTVATRTWLAGIDAADFARPSVLDGWDVRTLLGHLVLSHEGLGRVLDTRADGSAVPGAEYVRRYRRDVDVIAASTAETTGDHSPPELIDRLRPQIGEVTLTDRMVLAGPRGPITALDWVLSRVVEAVVHADDLSRSLPAREPVPLARAALAAAVRTLAEILAAQAPGRSVEVRVPPFVAVQAVAGPRHTRGTPANVVEADPLSWLRLATGRTDFASETAAGTVRATGRRSDLSALLPLLS